MIEFSILNLILNTETAVEFFSLVFLWIISIGDRRWEVATPQDMRRHRRVVLSTTSSASPQQHHNSTVTVHPEPDLAVHRCSEAPLRDFDPMLVEVEACTTTEHVCCPGWEPALVPVSQPGS